MIVMNTKESQMTTQDVQIRPATKDDVCYECEKPIEGNVVEVKIAPDEVHFRCTQCHDMNHSVQVTY